MDQKAIPKPKRGERNIYCPYYGVCLDYAVNHAWQSWNCSECQHKMTRHAISQRDYVMSNAVAYYELPLNAVRSIAKDAFE